LGGEISTILTKKLNKFAPKFLPSTSHTCEGSVLYFKNQYRKADRDPWTL